MALVRETTLRSVALHLCPLLAAFLILRTPVAGVSAFVALGWGLFLIVGFAGWGVFIERTLLDRVRLDWGLRCGLGMALVVIAAGGFLALAHLSLRPVLLAIAVAGALFVANEVAREASSNDSKPQGPPSSANKISADVWLFACVAFSLGVVLCIHALGEGVATIGNGNDDPSYIVIAKDFLARGTSLQPFSFRRLCAYGGHEVLLAMFIAPGVPAGFLYMFDAGLCPIVLAVVVLGAYPIARPAMRPLLVLAAAYVLFVPVVQMNIASQGSTLVMVVVLYRVLSSGALRALRVRRPSLKAAVVAALPIVALCSLKNSNVVPAGVITLAVILGDVSTSTDSWAIKGERAAIFVGAIIAMLAPFVIMSQLTGGSPLFPVTLGHYRRDYGFLQLTKPTFRESLQAFGNGIVGDVKDPQPTWLFFALVLLVADDVAILGGLFVAPLVLIASVAVAAPNALSRDVVRYSYGFQHGVVIASCLYLATGKLRGMSRGAVASAIAIAAMLVQLRARWTAAGGIELNYLAQTWDHAAPRPDANEQHIALQSALVPGATLLAVVDAPNFFDFHKQHILNFDFPEAVSPAPHVTASQGLEPFADYLRHAGVRYVASMKRGSSRDFYRRGDYEALVARHDPFESMARHTLDALDAIETFGKVHGILTETDTMFVVDLEAGR